MAGMDGREREHNQVGSQALRGVALVAATFREPPAPPVLSSQLTLVLCDEGGGDVDWGKTMQPLRAGEVLLRAPGQVSVVMHHAAPETRCRVLLIEPELFASGGAQGRPLTRFGSLVTGAPAITGGVAATWEAVTAQREAIEQQARLSALLSAVIELTATAPPQPQILSPAVARTREALHDRFADEVPLEQLAEIAGMSKCHLVHLFHKEVGLPPHAYQIQLRVARARQLVAAGVPLAEVATMTGFADQSHLTRLFKRVVGIPPGQYAALLAAQAARQAPVAVSQSS
ncbi:MAG: AraC family transcriptional regulator [Myxococcales bacterium]|nr:AraC family transcriptional regulator [Myxococcales bacterium]